MANSSDFSLLSNSFWNSSIVVPWIQFRVLVGRQVEVNDSNSLLNRLRTFKLRSSLMGRILSLKAFGYFGIDRNHSRSVDPVLDSSRVMSWAMLTEPPCDWRKTFVQLRCWLWVDLTYESREDFWAEFWVPVRSRLSPKSADASFTGTVSLAAALVPEPKALWISCQDFSANSLRSVSVPATRVFSNNIWPPNSAEWM